MRNSFPSIKIEAKTNELVKVELGIIMICLNKSYMNDGSKRIATNVPVYKE